LRVIILYIINIVQHYWESGQNLRLLQQGEDSQNSSLIIRQHQDKRELLGATSWYQCFEYLHEASQQTLGWQGHHRSLGQVVWVCRLKLQAVLINWEVQERHSQVKS
jgi:hypothetical protein